MDTKLWFLEGYLGDSQRIRRLGLHELPFRIGRQASSHLALDSAAVSRHHAVISAQDDGLVVEDLGSTNGTFLNHQRIDGPQVLRPGDILHFGDQEFRFVEQDLDGDTPHHTTQVRSGALPEQLPLGAREFHLLLLQGAVTAAFQPIVTPDGQSLAHELLGRGALDGLPSAPWPLFQIAESLELEVPLSELFRQRGLEIAAQLAPEGRYFFNIHPRELADPKRLLDCITGLRQRFPELRLVLEIHEAAVTEPVLIRRVRDHLTDLQIGLAYDDFGAGQARLLELTEVPPDFVKFDMTLIRDIHRAAPAKLHMIEMLQRFLTEMGVAGLAEGVETADELRVLRDLGIPYYQGFLFGRPSMSLVGECTPERTP